MFCLIDDFTFLMADTKIKGLKKLVSFESSEKKKKLACAIFIKICYVVCAINRAGKLICLHACLHEPDRAGLIDKPGGGEGGGRVKGNSVTEFRKKGNSGTVHHMILIFGAHV